MVCPLGMVGVRDGGEVTVRAYMTLRARALARELCAPHRGRLLGCTRERHLEMCARSQLHPSLMTWLS